ncbi:ABC transporter ATP-binding protein [Butyrivibrio sp.]|uniref:ABC transporter ATP-binding protein n=1 Tax=Butyrivibrio sp. TaxID=28121 RepID=UPI0025BD0F65|nr:ABC transporter ATP-binding protein [Butyrivibrio sp.]MBE5838844.1 ABC transporter ATP-binding protein [Butyrivibrio sp.]
MGKTLLNVEDLVVAFSMYRGDSLKKENLEVIHSLSLDVKEGEILAVVGSSGSGKSILASAVLDLLPKNAVVSGKITYDGEPLSMKTTPDLYGKEISFIPQSVDYLDPLMKVGKQVQGVKGSKARQEELFEKYRLGKDTEKKYPFQLSGGMARRVLISGAVMGNPKLIIADEPTPGLDLELAMETLKHFRTLADQGTGILMITHDIDLALNVADRIAVFYAGTIVEIASTQDFLSGRDALRHPYTKALYDALPQNGFKPIPGAQPYAGSLPSGCLFADRCPYRDDACAGEQPEREVRGGKVRCAHAT